MFVHIVDPIVSLCDHRSYPARGQDQINTLAEQQNGAGERNRPDFAAEVG